MEQKVTAPRLPRLDDIRDRLKRADPDGMCDEICAYGREDIAFLLALVEKTADVDMAERLAALTDEQLGDWWEELETAYRAPGEFPGVVALLRKALVGLLLKEQRI